MKGMHIIKVISQGWFVHSVGHKKSILKTR